MLRRLRIENLAVVEQTELTFGPGLNVLTGSTGAGKSLVLGAVNLLLGEKATVDLIRDGAEEAFVEAEFAVPAGFAGLDVPLSDNTLRVTRRVSRAGRSHVTVQGRAATVRDLRAVCTRLIEPHGQNEQYRLRDPAHHVHYVDAFAKNHAERERWDGALADWRSARAALERFDADVARAREQRELYQHRIDELARIAPRAGEKADLEARARVMANAEKIHGALDGVSAVLYDDEDGGAGARIAAARRKLASIAGVDARAHDVDEALAQAEALVQEAAASARGMRDALEFEPEDVERAQERLEVLSSLERRYRATVEEILVERDAWEAALAALANADGDRAVLVDALGAEETKLADAALALTASRDRAGKRLARTVSEQLQGLGMRGAAFRVDIGVEAGGHAGLRVDGRNVTVFEDGTDVVRMRIRTNPGEAEGALEAIASTGELSRVALVLKELAASVDAGATLLFDEIDAGVGADLGQALAEKLLALASRHQIVCITHMPQIAARGGAHLVVLKETDGDRTRVSVRAVERDERVREIARMLGGEAGSETRTALAIELLAPRPTLNSRNRVRP